MSRLNQFFYKVQFFFYPIEILKRCIKIMLVSKEILLNRITYYPKAVIKFENNFAKYIGMKYSITFGNGTSSIEAALFAINIKKGDEVIVPSCTFHASIGPILNAGATPVFVDTENKSFIVSAEDIINKITPKTKCIIIVHVFGYCVNINSIMKVVEKFNLKLIEDVSHAHGAKFDNRMIGSFGHISCFSLQGAKAIAAGEGGIALTNDKELYVKLSMHSHFDRHSNLFLKEDQKYIKTGIGHKSRAHPLGIAIAGVDLKFHDFINKKMLKNERYLRDIFKEIKGINTFYHQKNSIPGGFFGGFPILIDSNIISLDKVLEVFKYFGINVSRYPWPLHHKMELYIGDKNITLPNTEYILDNLILIDKRLLVYLPINQKINFKLIKRKLNENS